VLLPRDGLCVSTQVGCAVGCVFCMTGTDGLLRQLGSAEIVAQVALARTRRPVKKVVFMGMGEPAHNLDNVLEAIELLGTGATSATRTWCSPPWATRACSSACRWAGQAGAGLVAAHHARRSARRSCCRARRVSTPAELVELGERLRPRHRLPDPVPVDAAGRHQRHDDELDGIVRLLKGKYALMNMIPYNTVDGMPFRRPSWEKRRRDRPHLHRRGILTKLRNSAGQDVDGGCGA
jgi:23S rRNA (adenine2503-C2)-methyltransferase